MNKNKIKIIMKVMKKIIKNNINNKITRIKSNNMIKYKKVNIIHLSIKMKKINKEAFSSYKIRRKMLANHNRCIIPNTNKSLNICSNNNKKINLAMPIHLNKKIIK